MLTITNTNAGRNELFVFVGSHAEVAFLFDCLFDSLFDPNRPDVDYAFFDPENDHILPVYVYWQDVELFLDFLLPLLDNEIEIKNCTSWQPAQVEQLDFFDLLHEPVEEEVYVPVKLNWRQKVQNFLMNKIVVESVA